MGQLEGLMLLSLSDLSELDELPICIFGLPTERLLMMDRFSSYLTWLSVPISMLTNLVRLKLCNLPKLKQLPKTTSLHTKLTRLKLVDLSPSQLT